MTLTHGQWHLQLIRRTGKPHVYRENGEWRILERTAPGEWWLSRLDLSPRDASHPAAA